MSSHVILGAAAGGVVLAIVILQVVAWVLRRAQAESVERRPQQYMIQAAVPSDKVQAMQLPVRDEPVHVRLEREA